MEDILPSTLEVLYLRDLYFYGTCHSDHHTVMNDGPLQLLQQLYDTARTYRAKLPNLTKLILDEYWSDANLECPDVVPWIPDFTEQFARVGIEVQRDITVDHPFALFGLPEEAARMRFKGGCAYFHVHDGGASAPVPLHDVIRERYVRAEVDYDLLNL